MLSKSVFLLLSLSVYFPVRGIIRDHEYFPGEKIFLTGCCYFETRPDHVVNVNWLLSDENLSDPNVTVRNHAAASSLELQIDSLPVEYNNSIIRCTVSIADDTICECQWHLLAKDVTTTAQSTSPDTDHMSPGAPGHGDNTTPGLNPVTGDNITSPILAIGSSEFSPPHLGKNATSTMSMVIPVVVVVAAAVVVVVVVVILFVRFSRRKRNDKEAEEPKVSPHNSTEETIIENDSECERDGISSGKNSSGKPRKRTVVKRGHQDKNNGSTASSPRPSLSSLHQFVAEVSDSDPPSSTVQSGQMSTDDVDQPVRVYVGKNGIEVKGNYNL